MALTLWLDLSAQILMSFFLSPCQWQCCSSSSWLIISLYGTERRTLCIRLNLYFLGSDFQCLFSQLSIYRSISLVFLTSYFWLSVSTFPSKTVFSVSLPSTVFISLSLSRPPCYRLSFCECLIGLWLIVSALSIYLLDYVTFLASLALFYC